MALINLTSAIILILLGMRQLRKGLDRLFGNQLLEWLQNTAQNRYKGFLAGIVAGVISPSSSAIAMLSVIDSQLMPRNGCGCPLNTFGN